MPISLSSTARKLAILLGLIAVMVIILHGKGVLSAPHNGFDLTDATVPVDEIHHGGPPRDGIPAIDRPRFLSAGRAEFLAPDDRVLGITRNGVAKAYAVRILNYHEIVNDAFGGEPITVTYCPLCGTGMAFLAEREGRAVDFGVSGLLYNSDMLLYDRETESLWSQILGEAISGPLRGAELTPVPITYTSWADWRARHPETLVLSTDTGFRRDYTRNPYPGYDASEDLFFPVNHVSRRYHPKERVIGLELGGEQKAYPFSELSRSVSPLVDEVGGERVTIEYDVEHRTGRILDASGVQIPTVSGFWFAWIAFHPDSGVYTATN
jgi:hypothetical protein